MRNYLCLKIHSLSKILHFQASVNLLGKCGVREAAEKLAATGGFTIKSNLQRAQSHTLLGF